MFGIGADTDWGKVLTDLATIGSTTAVTLRSKPWKTGVAPSPTGPVVYEQPTSMNTKLVIGGIALIGIGIVAYSILKKKRA